jgi:hypothetical protein
MPSASTNPLHDVDGVRSQQRRVSFRLNVDCVLGISDRPAVGRPPVALPYLEKGRAQRSGSVGSPPSSRRCAAGAGAGRRGMQKHVDEVVVVLGGGAGADCHALRQQVALKPGEARPYPDLSAVGDRA